MEYKYQRDYDKLREMCPPQHFIGQDIDSAYRYLFSENDPRNFLPQSTVIQSVLLNK
jgi:hypothetical protein